MLRIEPREATENSETAKKSYATKTTGSTTTVYKGEVELLRFDEKTGTLNIYISNPELWRLIRSYDETKMLKIPLPGGDRALIDKVKSIKTINGINPIYRFGNDGTLLVR